MSLEQLALLGVGVVAGGLGALLGVGGGVILVPGFALVAGLAFRQAVAASLVCVVATSVAGSVVHLRNRRTQLEIALQLQFFTVLGAVSGGLLAVLVPAAPLHIAFATLLLYAAWQMIPLPERPRRIAPAAATLASRRSLASGASLGGGVVSSMLGVGGGIVFAPLLHLMLGERFDRAAATSIYMIGVTSAAGALVYLARGDVAAAATGPALLGVLGGSALAALLGHRLDHRALKAGLALLLLYMAVEMARHGIAQL